MDRIFKLCEICHAKRDDLRYSPDRNVCRCIWLKEVFPKPLRREAVEQVLKALREA